MNPLDGQVAVVTGASSGIGRAIALALAERGARLCMVGRDLDALRAVELATANPQAGHRCLRADLALDRDVDDLAAELARDLPRVDALVHAAGVLHWGDFVTGTPEQFDEQYRTNLRSPYVLSQKLLPPLKSAKGQIVFVNSSAGLSARANVGAYAATKHGLKAVADSLREEVNAAGVRVLGLYVGRTATRMQAGLHAIEGRGYDPQSLIQPEDVATLTVQALSLPRTVEVTGITLRPMR